jgi:hypothetical protein
MKFYKFMQPCLEEDDGVNLGGSVGATDAQAADVQNNDDSSDVQDTGASEATGIDGAADQKQVQSNDDNAKYAAARREAETQAKALKERQDNFAKQYGYSSFEEMEHAEQVRQYAQQNNVDPAMAEMKIKQDKLESMIAMQGHQARISEEKRSLQNEIFFKDLESEIDATLKADPSLSVKVVYEYIRGVKMPELMKKQTAAANQRTLNNINGKSHIKPDGKSTDNDFIDIDPQEFKMAQMLNPKETLDSYRAWKKSQK